MTENANSATNSTSDSTRDSTGDSTVGALLFRWRSYLPIGVVLGLFGGLYLLGPSPIATIRTWVWAGLLVSGVGLGLRVYAVAQAPPGTSGRHRRQFAAMLNTFGVYSVMRHPLYVGNVLVWIGVSMTSGWLGGTLASAAIGMLMFGLIVRHEDGFLRRKFGLEFGEWAAVTPAFWPRPGLWRPSRRVAPLGPCRCIRVLHTPFCGPGSPDLRGAARACARAAAGRHPSPGGCCSSGTAPSTSDCAVGAHCDAVQQKREPPRRPRLRLSSAQR